MRERQSRRQACQVFFFRNAVVSKKARRNNWATKKDQNLTFHCVYLDDILYKWSAKPAAKDKQLFPTSHWFTWSACVISGGLRYITSVFFPSLLALCIRFLGVIKKEQLEFWKNKKNNNPPTKNQTFFFWKNKHKTPPQEGNCSKSQQVDTPETPWFGRILWP